MTKLSVTIVQKIRNIRWLWHNCMNINWLSKLCLKLG